MTRARKFLAGCLFYLLAASTFTARAEEPDLNALVGSWKFRFTWSDLVNDSGSLVAKRINSGIEFTCTDCEKPQFLRGTVAGNGRIAWEFRAENGIQGKCDNDKGWQPVLPVFESGNREIRFWYYLHLEGNCSVQLKRAPVKFTLVRD